MYPVVGAQCSGLATCVVLNRAFVCAQGAQAVLDILQKVEDLVKEIPPVDNKASRFGNPAFRTFYDRVGEVSYISSQHIEHPV